MTIATFILLNFSLANVLLLAIALNWFNDKLDSLKAQVLQLANATATGDQRVIDALAAKLDEQAAQLETLKSAPTPKRRSILDLQSPLFQNPVPVGEPQTGLSAGLQKLRDRRRQGIKRPSNPWFNSAPADTDSAFSEVWAATEHQEDQLLQTLQTADQVLTQSDRSAETIVQQAQELNKALQEFEQRATSDLNDPQLAAAIAAER
ncbi:MAG: hypothetical protein AAGF24_03525 [Cyanobacteria bacterium P01_H01_bin.121]